MAEAAADASRRQSRHRSQKQARLVCHSWHLQIRCREAAILVPDAGLRMHDDGF
jgi:hypothetical protein